MVKVPGRTKAMVLLPGLLLAYTCGYLLCMLDALSGFAQVSALDLSQNGIGHFGIPRQHIRLNHVSTLMVGCRGDCGSGHSSNINRNLCTLHSVPWLRDVQNAGFSGEISALLHSVPCFPETSAGQHLQSSKTQRPKSPESARKITLHKIILGEARPDPYINFLPQKFYAVKFPVIIADNISPKQKNGMK